MAAMSISPMGKGLGGWILRPARRSSWLLLSTEAMREKGMVAAAMGTTALSYDDQWWAVPVKMGDCGAFGGDRYL